jgi:hypothetical protein
METETNDSPRGASTTRLLRPFRAAGEISPASLTQAVHGLVLFVAVVGATFIADYPAWRMLLLSAGAVVLFYLAHVYAASLGSRNAPNASGSTVLRTVFGEARHSLSLLEACIAPMLPLLLAAIGIIPVQTAYYASLTIGLVALAFVGFSTLRGRSASVRRSLVGGAASAGFGAVIIAAETFLH